MMRIMNVDISVGHGALSDRGSIIYYRTAVEQPGGGLSDGGSRIYRIIRPGLNELGKCPTRVQ